MYGSPGDSNENIPEYKTQILQFLDTVLEDEKIQKMDMKLIHNYLKSGLYLFLFRFFSTIIIPFTL